MDPQTPQLPNAKTVFRARQADIARRVVTPEEQQLHDHSVHTYPELSLSPGEYVLEVVRRHPIGLVTIWAVTLLLIFMVLALVPLYGMSRDFLAHTLMLNVNSLISAPTLAIPALLLAAIFLLGGFIAAYVYNANKFYITTESIVQFVQYSLFNSKQQVVNLINVEDVSADQDGIIQQLFNYGTLRLSTQGQETIYHFRFVANPNVVVHHVNDATEIAVQRLENSGVPPTELAS